MSDAHPPTDNPINPAVRYEKTDASFRAVVAFGIALATVCVAVAAFLWGLYVYAIYHEDEVKRSDLPWTPAELRGPAQVPRTRPGPLEPGTPQSGLDPRPRLEGLDPSSPQHDIGGLRPGTAQQQNKEDDDFLARGSGWIDRGKGLVHLPIEQAMAKVAGQLPVRKGAEASAPEEFLQAPSRSSSGREPRGDK